MANTKDPNETEINTLRALRTPGRVIHYRSVFERELEGPSEPPAADPLETEEVKDRE